jgi:hypothetical protein
VPRQRPGIPNAVGPGWGGAERNHDGTHANQFLGSAASSPPPAQDSSATTASVDVGRTQTLENGAAIDTTATILLDVSQQDAGVQGPVDLTDARSMDTTRGRRYQARVTSLA